MNKKLTVLLISGMLLTAAPAFAADYDQKNVFNKITDWTVTLFKTPAERSQVIDQRVERRAKRRQAYVTFDEKKADVNRKYKQDLLNISNENSGTEQMAEKLKNAYNERNEKVQELKMEYNKDIAG